MGDSTSRAGAAPPETVEEIADLFTVPRSTIYGYLNTESHSVAADQS